MLFSGKKNLPNTKTTMIFLSPEKLPLTSCNQTINYILGTDLKKVAKQISDSSIWKVQTESQIQKVHIMSGKKLN